jgi:hypothetical protein
MQLCSDATKVNATIVLLAITERLWRANGTILAAQHLSRSPKRSSYDRRCLAR